MADIVRNHQLSWESTTDSVEDQLQDQLFEEFNSLSVVYGLPLEMVTPFYSSRLPTRSADLDKSQELLKE